MDHDEDTARDPTAGAPSPLTVAAGVRRPAAGAGRPTPDRRRPAAAGTGPRDQPAPSWPSRSPARSRSSGRSRRSASRSCSASRAARSCPAYDPIFDSKVRHILVRHEQGAGHAATGYAQATGKVGVCIATSGPGATNLVTPIADAYMDSVPMVAITGQVPRGAIGSDAFQEADIHGITLPITKHNYLVQSAEDLPRVLAEAFHLAGTGRPGPVLVDIPKDVLQARTEFSWPPTMELPGYRPTLQPHGKQIREAASLIAMARRPVLYVGGGVLKAGASEALKQAGRAHRRAGGHHADGAGRLPGQPPAAHGHARACTARSARSTRCRRPTCSSRWAPASTTGSPASWTASRPGAAIIHADIDPAEIGKNRAADVPIVGDARYVIDELIGAVAAEHKAGHRADIADWWRQLDDIRERYPLGWEEPPDGTLVAAVRHQAARRDRRPGRDLRRRRRPAPDVGVAVHLVREAGHLAQLRRRSARWGTPCRPPWARRSAGPTRSCGRSTATAASR